MKQVLIYSIQSEPIENILNGLKTIEVRKRDLPQWAKDKLARGEKVEGYGYCTMGKPYLYDVFGRYTLSVKYTTDFYKHNGKVVVKFEVSGTTRYVDCSGCTNTENGYECENNFMYLLSVDPILRKSTCLEADEIEDYGNGADLYAHHFTNIQPIEPMELDNFISDSKSYNECPFAMSLAEEYMTSEEILINRGGKILTKAPQSFQSAWVKGE